MELDRFAYGLPDPQCAPVVAYCDACGGEIYAGDAYLELPSGEMVCDRMECLAEAVGAERVRAGEDG